MEYRMSRKKKSFDIVNLMGGKRTTDVSEHNPKKFDCAITEILQHNKKTRKKDVKTNLL